MDTAAVLPSEETTTIASNTWTGVTSKVVIPATSDSMPSNGGTNRPNSHRAKLTQQQAGELGIEFVFIPPYSPTLNAIEPLWKDLKREISPEIFEDKDHFREFLTERSLRLSYRLSFAVDWIETFLPDVQKLR